MPRNEGIRQMSDKSDKDVDPKTTDDDGTPVENPSG
jgi:hypothetical protein